MNLLIDATNIAPGGGLIVMGNLLRQWQMLGVDIRAKAIVSRKATAEGLKKFRDDMEIIPFMPEASSAEVFIGRQFRLGRQVEKLHCDVVFAIGGMIGHCGLPQYVHHQNLWSFQHKTIVQTMRLLGLKDTCRCRLQRSGTVSALKNAKCNTFISDYMRRLACTMIPSSESRSFTVSNAAAVEVKHDNFNPSAKPIIAAIQNADYYKDALTLTGVLAECVNRRPDVDWRLKIAGGGNWNYVRRMADKLGVLDRIAFLGHSSLDEITKLLDEAFCLIFPSRCEGFGIPPLDAMARGCAVISSNVDALPEVVGDGGVLISPGNAGCFAEIAVELWNDTARRKKLVDAGYLQVEKFSWERSASKLAELLLRDMI